MKTTSFVILLSLCVAGCAGRKEKSQGGAFSSPQDSVQNTEKTEAEDGEDPDTESDIRGTDFLTQGFCRQWNPEYLFRKKQCCASLDYRHRRKPKSCSAQRKAKLCEEMTPAQKLMKGEHLDLLDRAFQRTGRLENLGMLQSFCTADNGFLVNGFRIMGTETNRIILNNPNRCAQFGTSGLVLLLHRLGKAVHQEFQAQEKFKGVHFVIGDLSAPRGGCLPTRRGSHFGHTSGLDADVGFLHAIPNQESSRIFIKKLDAPLNLWLLKKIIEVSPVCVSRIFLDRKHIATLNKEVQSSLPSDVEAWNQLRPLFKHAGGHRNHYHIRVGTHVRKSTDPIQCENAKKI